MGSWEPEAADHTEHSRLPTLLHWHQPLLYLNKTKHVNGEYNPFSKASFNTANVLM